MRILLAGFEPWKGSVNPAGAVAKSLDGMTIEGGRVVGVEVPEDFYGLPRITRSLVKEHRPDAVISLGWDYTRAVKVENVAVNMMFAVFGDQLVPDNRGRSPRGVPISKRGPVALRSTLPVRSIVSDLSAAGIPAVESYDAGTHGCNTMMYSFLMAVRKERHGVSGHIHLPPTEGVDARFPVEKMELDTERKAIEIAVGSCARSLRRR
ncbi:MAG: pyroglutamyl-peptidase I [Nitrososphaerota archaeon]|nr:pyroglutamyl-peptidase I [Nitrososphaerota archaeon]